MPGIKLLPGETEDEYWQRVNSIINSLDCVDRRNEQVIARYPSKYRIVPYAADVLTGFLKCDYDIEETEAKFLRKDYALAN